MKDRFTLELSRHQAKVLTSALLFVKEFMELPEGKAIRNRLEESVKAAWR